MQNYKHQDEVLDRSRDRSEYALYLEPGTGKSRITIKTAEHWHKMHGLRLQIVVCPKTMMLTWLSEIEKHHETDSNVYVWKGIKTKAQLDGFNYFVRQCNGTTLAYFICNIDALIGPKFQRIMHHMITQVPQFALAIDEATSIKSMKADRTQEAIQLGRKAKMRRILTGTPIVQSPLDLYAQAEFLNHGILGHKNYYSFKARYAEVQRVKYGTRVFDKITGFRDLDQLAHKVREYSSIVKLDDCVDMPERVFKTVMVELTEEQRKAYDELKGKAVAYIQEHEVTALNVLAMVTRLLQIVSGQLKIREGVYVSIDNNRLEALKELVEECNDQCLVWCPYVQSARDIVAYLGDLAVHVSSDLDVDAREDVINQFRKGKKVLVMNPQSAAHGLTLNEASTSIYFGNTYNLEHRLHSLARNYRIGQTKKTVVIDMVSPGTLESKVLESLKAKENLADKVVGKKAALELIEAA